ncbi:MAG: BA14K family protein [Rhodobacteraceae bacterium]|nr:BA14K family protein [Paracoccaceae bacterium]
MTNFKRIIAIALTGAFFIQAATAAEAGPRHHHGYHNGGHHHGAGRHRKNDNVGAALAAGIIGLAAGAIIVGATNQSRRPAPVYTPPAPRHPQYGHYNNRRHTAQLGFQPWSPAWYRHCSAKYRSFNPQTGTYTTYQGAVKFCQ